MEMKSQDSDVKMINFVSFCSPYKCIILYIIYGISRRIITLINAFMNHLMFNP